MTRKRETIIKELQYEPNGGKHLYGVHTPRFNDDPTVHRFFVPDVDDEQVLVTGVWNNHGNDNLLRGPVALLYLNRLLQWFSWATSWGIQIQLAKPARLSMEITQFVDRPYVESAIDQAYAAWLRKNPGGSPEDWAAYTLNHVRSGNVECEISSCHENIVPGTTCCVEHQKFA